MNSTPVKRNNPVQGMEEQKQKETTLTKIIPDDGKVLFSDVPLCREHFQLKPPSRISKLNKNL